MSGLFGADAPPGFSYREDFLARTDEADLLEEVAGVTFSEVVLRGVVARRRVAFFGDSDSLEASSPLPPFLLPWRDKVANWAKRPPAAFAMALISEYRPGTPIGWHRDSPQYDVVAGISLLSACRMRFRPYRRAAMISGGTTRHSATHEVVLNRRSAYLMTGASRQDYEHHIPPVRELRYSVTFRTLR
jgi:alkylated DNA repair dioxygenase AlkB